VFEVRGLFLFDLVLATHDTASSANTLIPRIGPQFGKQVADSTSHRWERVLDTATGLSAGQLSTALHVSKAPSGDVLSDRS
jgi:hypothetical protein